MSKGYREDRREFLKSMGRWAALGGLTLGIGMLVKKSDDRPIETCVSDGICRKCADLKNCGLPQAISFKQGNK